MAMKLAAVTAAAALMPTAIAAARLVAVAVRAAG